MSYILLPPEGGGANPYFKDPVVTVGDLPLTDDTGTIRLVETEGRIYWFDGASWVATPDGIGDLLTSYQDYTATNLGASTAWGYVTSISLTPGVWQVSGYVGFRQNSAVLSSACLAIVTTSTTAASFLGLPLTAPFMVTDADMVLPLFPQFFTVLTTTTYYLNTKLTYTGSPLQAGHLSAVRVG